MGACTISDRGTCVSLRNKGDLVVAVEGDRRMFNQ
jgi:tungstate transport system substrate-binding protein